MFFAQFLKLSDDAGPPIHNSSEDVEYQDFDRLHRAARTRGNGESEMTILSYDVIGLR